LIVTGCADGSGAGGKPFEDGEVGNLKR